MKPFNKEFTPLSYAQNPHLQTLMGGVVRKSFPVEYKRERLTLRDGDFIDLDWSIVKDDKTRNLVVMGHGLEGSSYSKYVLSAVHHLNQEGHNVLVWNNRSCSGEMNLLPSLYHTGYFFDLDELLTILSLRGYKSFTLVGYSMSANIGLRLFAHLSSHVQSYKEAIKLGVFISPPCDLTSCSIELAKRSNRLYMEYFLMSLRKKLYLKRHQIKSLGLDWKKSLTMKNFVEFDEYYTAPLFGFMSARDYWKKASSIHELEEIKIPTLIISSYDDPFLGQTCYPQIQNSSVKTLYTTKGGHVGFFDQAPSQKTWIDQILIDLHCDHISS